MQHKRLAIVGCGSSGLICLKYALDELPDWEIVCYEKTADITGCWGRPPRGFVSTSTKYTTQFACHRQYDATVAIDVDSSDRRSRYREFFQDDEYGQYLESFIDAFHLDRHVVRNCSVTEIARYDDGDWQLTLARGDQHSSERFSAVVICTGLADQVRPLNCEIDTLQSIDPDIPITGKRVVVVGGGESGVDMAQRLSQPELNNQVYLSLRSGIRVSPRYHPIRGVPSDFLRNRLLLSIHEDIRNWIGQRFVEFRIRSQEILERIFPSKISRSQEVEVDTLERRKFWSLKLTQTAKDQLFNMFHNKSDDFLDSVAEDRITIIGNNVDDCYRNYYQFDSSDTMTIEPELIVPAIGFQSRLAEISHGQFALRDFYLGCCHVEYDNLYLIGFTRPVIGNIPSISEMQARYVCGLIASRFARPHDIAARHRAKRSKLQQRYSRLDTDQVYPVEMFPYCDELATQMNCFPSLRKVGSIVRWSNFMLSPATTMHYFDAHITHNDIAKAPIHAPSLITLLLILIKPFDLAYRARRQLKTRR